VVVDCSVDVVIADAPTADLLATAVGFPAAAVGILPIFLTSMWIRSPGAARS
jgi:hypothetical protein